LSAHAANVPDNAFSPRGNSRVADALILLEWALGSHGLDEDFGTILFEEQAVAGPNAEGAANLVRHCDLSFACDASLFLH
jgi:hypothetical protein